MNPSRFSSSRSLGSAALGALLLFGCIEAPEAGDDLAAATSTSEQELTLLPRLLVANSRGHNVLAFTQATGLSLGELIPAGRGGLDDPDGMAIGPDGRLYISSGQTPERSAILRFDARTGAFVDVFASGHGLHRPYGMVFGPDGLLYVSSFRSDQLLRFDAHTGAFVDVFATGDGVAGGLNGPNGLAFGPDGGLYVATEGSVAGEFPGLPSEVLRYDVTTRQSRVFVQQPTPSPSGFGFVSLLGVQFGPDCRLPLPGTCDLFVSDFANDVRRYDARTGALKATLDTNYTGTIPSGNFVGGLSFGVAGQLFVAAFDLAAEGNPGAVLRYHGFLNLPSPGFGKSGALYIGETPALSRSIGILAINPGRR
jgi:outer membrane protein assembly factor BamB